MVLSRERYTVEETQIIVSLTLHCANCGMGFETTDADDIPEAYDWVQYHECEDEED